MNLQTFRHLVDVDSI